MYHEDEEDDFEDHVNIHEGHDHSHDGEGNEEEGIINIIRRIEIWKNLQSLPNSRCSYGHILISLDYSIRTRQLIVKVN